MRCLTCFFFSKFQRLITKTMVLLIIASIPENFNCSLCVVLKIQWNFHCTKFRLKWYYFNLWVRLDQMLPKCNFFKFHLHYQKLCHLVIYYAKFIKTEAILIFGTKLSRKVPEVKIIKFCLHYQKILFNYLLCHFFTKTEER